MAILRRLRSAFGSRDVRPSRVRIRTIVCDCEDYLNKPDLLAYLAGIQATWAEAGDEGGASAVADIIGMLLTPISVRERVGVFD